MQGPWEKTNGTASIKKTLGGSFIEEEYSGTKEGKPFLWKVFFARNNMTHLFQRTFIDSDHGVLMEFEGKKESGSLIFNRLWRYQNGNVVKLRLYISCYRITVLAWKACVSLKEARYGM